MFRICALAQFIKVPSVKMYNILRNFIDHISLLPRRASGISNTNCIEQPENIEQR